MAAVCDQLFEGTELVISDNGSADGTVDAVRAFIAAHPGRPIRLITKAENVGFDRNLLAVVASARGEYCWLLGDDDLPRPGSLSRLVSEVQRRPPVVHLLVNYARRDADSRRITKARMVALKSDLNAESASDFFFHSIPRPSYFRRLGTNVITMSANVVQRSRWLEEASNAERFIGCNMIHVFIIAAMIGADATTRFIAEPQVDYLSNNHRAWSNDVWLDYRTKVYGWLRLLGYDSAQLATVEAEAVTHRTWRDVARAIRERLVGSGPQSRAET
jgi:abequosyltransferase